MKKIHNYLKAKPTPASFIIMVLCGITLGKALGMLVSNLI